MMMASGAFSTTSSLRINLVQILKSEGKKRFGHFVGKIYKLKENDKKPVISSPSNFEHTVHVGFDPHTGEFTVSTVETSHERSIALPTLKNTNKERICNCKGLKPIVVYRMEFKRLSGLPRE